MKVIGQTDKRGIIIPFELPVEKVLEPGDIVKEDGFVYRVWSDGQHGFRLWNIKQQWQMAVEEFVPSSSALDVMGMGW